MAFRARLHSYTCKASLWQISLVDSLPACSQSPCSQILIPHSRSWIPSSQLPITNALLPCPNSSNPGLPIAIFNSHTQFPICTLLFTFSNSQFPLPHSPFSSPGFLRPHSRSHKIPQYTIHQTSSEAPQNPRQLLDDRATPRRCPTEVVALTQKRLH